MKNTFNKMKSMLNMKSSLLKALQKDLESALIKIDQRDARIDSLQYEVDFKTNANKRLQALLEAESRTNDELAAKYYRLQFELDDLKTQLEQAKREAEWWREQDEDEEYQASLSKVVEIAPDNDIIKVGKREEYELDDKCFEEE